MKNIERRWWLAGIAALGLVAGGCSSSTGAKAAPTTNAPATSAAPSTTSGAASTTVPGSTTPTQHHVAATPASDALAAMMISTVPGHTLQPDSVGDTGPSDLRKAADDDGDKDARAVLVKDGFQVGYQRLFVTGSKDREVIVFIYRFATHAGAAAYEARGHAEMAADKSIKPQSFTVTGIPGAHGLHATTSDGTDVHVVSYVKGVYAVQIVTTAKDAAADIAPSAADLATEQYAKV